MPSFPNIENTLLIPGPSGNIEVITSPGEKKATAIICHPHPLHEGTMHNKVVTTLARVFKELGLKSLRFNFRGVGKSEGQHDFGMGETDDVIALAQWIKTQFPEDDIWLAGFSFGGFVAARASLILKPSHLITIAPQVSRFIESDLISVPCPWLLVQGEKDDVVHSEQVFEWVETLDPTPNVIRIPEAGHFFHGKLVELREQLVSYF